MSTHATAQFAITGWDEKTWDGKDHSTVSGRKLTHAKITTTLTGDLVGTSEQEFSMFYGEDGTAHYVGLEQVTGKLAGRTGSFVLQHTGKYENGIAASTFTVVPGSGTGELRGLTGKGAGEAEGDKAPYPLEFEYDFE